MTEREVKELPDSPYQIIIADIWERILKHREFGIDDDFFGVGGTSLGAIGVITELNESFEMDMDDIFANMTIRNIADCLRENPEAMKQNFKNILHFNPLKSIDPEEWNHYQAEYKKVTEVKRQSDKYHQVMVLGATGFLGIYLLHELLVQTDVSAVLLIRDTKDGGSRVEKQYEYYFGQGSYAQYQDRIQVVTGDLAQPEMGLAAETYQSLQQSVDAVINSAALVKHMGKNDDFTSVNIKTVETILEFAAAGCKKVIHHMSTIGIAYGDQGENERTLFTEYDEQIDHQLNNQYLSSKYQAEQKLIEARVRGIDSTIYRMSGILFDSTTGKYQQNMEQSTAYVFYRALFKLGIIPKEIERPMDISNVDMVSKAIIRLMFCNQNTNQIYHVINPKAIPIADILKMMRGDHSDIQLTEMSVDDVFTYYQTDQIPKSYFHELAFQCEIISSIGKNQFHICMEKTTRILEQLDFSWNLVDTEVIQSACKEAKREGFC